LAISQQKKNKKLGGYLRKQGKRATRSPCRRGHEGMIWCPQKRKGEREGWEKGVAGKSKFFNSKMNEFKKWIL
jgi:hypothetical protein